MPKRKTVDDSATQPAAAADVKKTRSRSAASKPNTPAATHKRSSKKAVVESTEAVVPETAAPQAVRVPTHEEIARLAYSYWEARGRQHGFAEEDWIRAERTLLELA